MYYNKASFTYNLRELSGQWRQFRGLGAKTGRRLRKKKIGEIASLLLLLFRYTS